MLTVLQTPYCNQSGQFCDITVLQALQFGREILHPHQHTPLSRGVGGLGGCDQDDGDVSFSLFFPKPGSEERLGKGEDLTRRIHDGA